MEIYPFFLSLDQEFPPCSSKNCRRMDEPSWLFFDFNKKELVLASPLDDTVWCTYFLNIECNSLDQKVHD